MIRADTLLSKDKKPGDESAERQGTALSKRLGKSLSPGSGGPHIKHFVGEVSALAEPFRRMGSGALTVQKSARPSPVMLLPGFGTHPFRMRYMGSKLEEAGHRATDWGMGWNLGPTVENIEELQGNIRAYYEECGERVALIGWSLGGLFAREMAKRETDAISLVVTMGSPFSGDPHDNNAWRAYELIAGHPVNDAPMLGTMAVKPPVPTVALWSARDGIVAPRCACGNPFERDRAEALRCTHLGFANSGEAIEAVLRALEKDAL